MFIEYPHFKDSSGNRFVLNSLINLAIINDGWLIIDELNFEDTLQKIANALYTRSNVAIALNDPSQEAHFHLSSWDQNPIEINDKLKILKIAQKSDEQIN